MIDLDHNATTRPQPEVLEVLQRHLRENYANPGSQHSLGRRARRVLEEAREQIAEILGAAPDELIFTSGGTESNNLALLGLAEGPLGRAAIAQGGAARLALPGGEHPSVRVAAEQLVMQGWRLVELPLDEEGRLAETRIAELPWDEIRLVTAILAHNETGVIQNLSLLSRECRARGIPLHTDAVQAVGKIPLSFQQLGVDTLAFGAHKFHGPRGVGGLLVRRGLRLAARQLGGHQEAGLRAGTEPVALVAAMAMALKLAHEEGLSRNQYVLQLRDRLEQGLREAARPVVINGGGAPRLPNTLNIAFPGLSGEPLLISLDLEGIACSLGSTCASGSAEPAAVLVAMGCPPEVLESSLRFSLGVDNTAEEIEEAIRRIGRVVARLRSPSGREPVPEPACGPSLSRSVDPGPVARGG